MNKVLPYGRTFFKMYIKIHPDNEEQRLLIHKITL